MDGIFWAFLRSFHWYYIHRMYITHIKCHSRMQHLVSKIQGGKTSNSFLNDKNTILVSENKPWLVYISLPHKLELKPCIVLFQFDAPQISVEWKSAISTYNESRLYWTPAPPKLDVAPANVKDVLFPEYQVRHKKLRHFLNSSSSVSIGIICIFPAVVCFAFSVVVFYLCYLNNQSFIFICSLNKQHSNFANALYQ